MNAKFATQKINRERGKIITNFAYLEGLISMFIVCSYFKIGEEERMEIMKAEILENSFFSFELKKQLLKKILTTRFKEQPINIPYSKIDRLQTLRNAIAHGRVDATSDDQQPSRLYDLRLIHGGKSYIFDDLVKEYEGLSNELQPLLEKLPGVTVTRLM